MKHIGMQLRNVKTSMGKTERPVGEFMYTFKQLLIGVILIVMSQGVLAVNSLETGNHLLDSCTDSEGYVNSGLCFGFIMGVSGRAQGKTWDGFSYCRPNGVTYVQIKKVFVKFLNEHPEMLHNAAWALLDLAMLEAFPCPAK